MSRLTPTRRLAATSLLTAVVALAPLSAAAAYVPVAVPTAVPDGACTDPDGVTVVVDLTDLGGEVEVGCADAPATGTQALQAAGFTDTRDASGLICAIDALPDPCPAQFTGSYWSYWYAEPGGEWQSYLEGSDTAVPAAGAIEGWRYSDGSAGPTLAPADLVAVTEQTTEPEVTAEAQTTAETETDSQEIGPATTDPVDPQVDRLPYLLGGAALLAVAVAAVVVARRRRAGSDD